MVSLTVSDAAGDFSLAEYFNVSQVVRQVRGSGQTDYLLTDSDAFRATMFAIRDADGDWQGNLFLGRTTVNPHGNYGFLPDALITGSVHGQAADQFVVSQVRQGYEPDQIVAHLFSGDDTIIGGIGGLDINGYAGDDYIECNAVESTRPNILRGGRGDDVIVGGHSVEVLHGGTGNDVLMPRELSSPGLTAGVYGDTGDDFLYSVAQPKLGGNISLHGGEGSDTFFYNHLKYNDASKIVDFNPDQDMIALDHAVFTSLPDQLTSDNFAYGTAAVDADDFLVFDPARNSLYYDPDANGSGGAYFICFAPDLDATNVVVIEHGPL